MHRILEGYVKGEGHMDLSDLGQEAGTMAQNIIDKGHFSPLTEVWGLEMPLWYPGLYAGASDVAGVYEGREAIIDFKQSNIEGEIVTIIQESRNNYDGIIINAAGKTLPACEPIAPSPYVNPTLNMHMPKIERVKP